MPLFTGQENALVRAVVQIAYANPFLPERIEGERAALGEDFEPAGAVWNIHAGAPRTTPNLDRLRVRSEQLLQTARAHLSEAKQFPREELALYEDLALFYLYHAFRNAIQESLRGGKGRKLSFYREFAAEFARVLEVPGITLPSRHDCAHVFAFFCNLWRAFDQIFNNIIGTSAAAARLRADVWCSIFTHDLRRYIRFLYDKMQDITCLITGPSGTGKELVARAISFSRYIPFDEKSMSFAEEFETGFHPLQLSSLSSTLIESELFGHRRGAFTGASEDHAGYFEVCGPYGAVFLDEIGETDRAIQVKLLRVLQYRTFQRLGDTTPLPFKGKILAATNRDLAQEMSSGRFREDLYYRICSDMVVTRPLCELLSGSEAELRNLVMYVARREVGEEADTLIDEVMEIIRKTLGLSYAWPGNFRELEQCVRNVLVRHEYHPAQRLPNTEQDRLAQDLLGGSITAEELLGRYATLVYSKTQNFEETARRLALDRRTVKSKIDQVLLEKLAASSPESNNPASNRQDGNNQESIEKQQST